MKVLGYNFISQKEPVFNAPALNESNNNLTALPEDQLEKIKEEKLQNPLKILKADLPQEEPAKFIMPKVAVGVYSQGQNDLEVVEKRIVAQFLEEQAKKKSIDAFIQMGTRTDDKILTCKDGKIIPLFQSYPNEPSPNMSKPEVLANFVYSFLNLYGDAPIKVLDLSNHGGGDMGAFSNDIFSDKTEAMMTVDGIGKAIKKGVELYEAKTAKKAKFDLVIFDQCLMSNLSVTEAMTNSEAVNYYLASPEITFGIGNPAQISSVLADVGMEDFEKNTAQKITDLVINSSSLDGWQHAPACSIIKCSKEKNTALTQAILDYNEALAKLPDAGTDGTDKYKLFDDGLENFTLGYIKSNLAYKVKGMGRFFELLNTQRLPQDAKVKITTLLKKMLSEEELPKELPKALEIPLKPALTLFKTMACDERLPQDFRLKASKVADLIKDPERLIAHSENPGFLGYDYTDAIGETIYAPLSKFYYWPEAWTDFSEDTHARKAQTKLGVIPPSKSSLLIENQKTGRTYELDPSLLGLK